MAKLNGRYRRGASASNAWQWPGFHSAMHKGAELVLENGGGYYSITCFVPRKPYYSIDSWDGVNSTRTNEDSVYMGPLRPTNFEKLPKFWIKWGH